MAGHFRRTENVESDKYYNMILKSEDGISFSIDRFCSVSELGYRFLATVGSDNQLWMTSCNRVCYAPVTYIFDGNNNNGLQLEIPDTSIDSFSSRDDQASLILKASDEVLMFHSYVEEGNKIVINLGYATSAGEQDDVFGTYIISSKSPRIMDGVRDLQLSLLSEGHWKLQTHTSPFYTEFFGKSAMFDALDEVTGKLDSAPYTTLTRSDFFVDFWKSEPFDDAGAGVTGVDVIAGGAVDCYPTENILSPTLIGAHKLGVKTKDLKDVLSLEDYPEITDTTVEAKIYGWSKAMGTGTVNDIVEVCLLVLHEDGTEENIYTSDGTHWTQTYPTTIAGEDPIVVTIAGLVAGDKIKSIAVTFESADSTQFTIARVELTTNVAVRFRYDDPNTPWDFDEVEVGLKIPGTGRPYVMLSRKPYDAFNFTSAAQFKHTVTGPISTYPTAVGVIGLAQDGNNFVCGRYNTANNKVEIIKSRDGIETVLASATPSFSVPDTLDIMLRHRNGHFQLYLKDLSSIWIEELAHDWVESDGWMFTSTTVSKWCGIYGYLSSPSFRTTGFSMSGSETQSNVDGVLHLPLEAIDDFPASGEFKVGESVYSYASKITTPAPPPTYDYGVRGPWQLRQNNLYSAPYGNGYGLECRDFYYTASGTTVYHKLISVNGVSTFYLDTQNWQPFQKTNGVIYYQRNRARFYSDTTSIGTMYWSTSMKVWISGGLYTIQRISGKPERHNEGDLVQLNMTGDVFCYYYYGAGGDDDVTVEDLIAKISAHAGVKTEFPGNVYDDTQDITSGYLVGTVDYREGFDLYFETDGATDFTMRCDTTDPRYDDASQTGIKVVLNSMGGNDYRLILRTYPADTVIERMDFVAMDQDHKFRVLAHDDFISFYMDGKWIHTFCLPELAHPTSNNIRLTGSFTANEIYLKDLSDWREAIYIDLETDAMSAISSVIQERPIETNWKYDGGTAYWYDLERSTIVQMVQPKRHDWDEVTPRDGASDAIVYGADEVKCLQFQPYHEEYGFATKVMRFPNLYSGALKAAKVVLQKAFEGRIQHELDIRPDIRLEIGDLLSVSYAASVTGTGVAMDIIVDSLALTVNDQGDTMTIRGRQDWGVFGS